MIANKVIGDSKVSRLVELTRRGTTVITSVESMENGQAVSDAAGKAGVRVKVVAECNIGMNRCGVPAGEPAASFALRVAELPGLDFQGVMGWEGHCAGIVDQAADFEYVRFN